MSAVFQYLPIEYMHCLRTKGLYFAPCSQFVDKLEFRFGYAHFSQGATWSQIDDALPAIFAKSELNGLIASTFVSCWSEDDQERYTMWEIYGRRMQAVRIKIPKKALERRLWDHGIRGACGPVTYDLTFSQVAPQFLTTIGRLTEFEDQHYNMFFHKHGFYSYEREYRAVSFDPIDALRVDDLIEEIVISPFAALSAGDTDVLNAQFGDRLKASSLQVSYQG